MKKIVILSDRPEGESGLIASLSVLFPECEIQILPARTKGLSAEIKINRVPENKAESPEMFEPERAKRVTVSPRERSAVTEFGSLKRRKPVQGG